MISVARFVMRSDPFMDTPMPQRVRSSRPQVSDRPAGRDALGCRDDGVGVNAVVPIEVGERAGLPKVLDTQRAHAMTADCADPGEGGRMTVEYRHDATMARHASEQAFDMRTRMHLPSFTRSLRGSPTGIEPVGRRDRKEANVSAILGHQSNGLDRYGSIAPE